MSESPETPASWTLTGTRPGTLLESLGIEIVEATPERVVATMPVDRRTLTPHGRLHGGASVALAETIATTGAALNVDRTRQIIVGVEINANHLRGVGEGAVTGTATPIHRGRGTQVWEIRITDAAGRLVSISRCTLAAIDRRRDG